MMMNKIFKVIRKLVKNISKFIDKKIVLPITRFFVSITKKVNLKVTITFLIFLVKKIKTNVIIN